MQSVEEDLAAWQREFPDLDADSLTPILRALVLVDSMELFRRRVLEPFGISASEYDLLAALRRSGVPYRLNPTVLTERLGRSSGGMTKMLKRLQASGYVERARDPEDGRGSLVVLSRRGLELQGRILGAFVAASRNRFEGLGRARLVEIGGAMNHFCEALER
jgi:DNA-binding MarR family transcriptional regulator